MIAEELPHYDYKLSKTGRYCVGLLNRFGWRHYCWYSKQQDAERCAEEMNAQLQYYLRVGAVKDNSARISSKA